MAQQRCSWHVEMVTWKLFVFLLRSVWRYTRPPVFAAAGNGHITVVRFLVELGVDADKANKDRATPLFAAAKNGNIKVINFLLEIGAENKTHRDGATPLLVAAEGGHVKVVHFLLQEFGPDTHKGNIDGATPFLSFLCGCSEWSS